MDETKHNQDTGNAATEGSVPGPRATSPLPELRPEWLALPPPGHGGPPRKPRGRFFTGSLLVGMLMLSMLFGSAGAEVTLLAAGQSTAPATAATTTTLQPVAQIAQATISSIYQQVSPSVVMIDSIIAGTGRFHTSAEATGTGIVVDKQGDILTNYHVIEGATSINVKLADGSAYTANVAASAPANDLALLKAGVPAAQIVPVTLGDASTVQVGQAVIAIGYPYDLDQSVTAGIVSGLNRDSATQSSQAMGQSRAALVGLIQIDAAINPGNSGGPLLNAQGQVIGINTMIESPVDGFTGIALTIPINQAKQVFPQIAQGGAES